MNDIQLSDVIRRKAEKFALDWHLIKYPSGTISGDFGAIVERVANDELGEDIIPFEEYEHLRGDAIAESIELMRDSLIIKFGGLNELATK
jgi:hypothetical protein